MQEKVEDLIRMLEEFTEEEYDRIIEILQIVIELIHSPLSI